MDRILGGRRPSTTHGGRVALTGVLCLLLAACGGSQPATPTAPATATIAPATIAPAPSSPTSATPTPAASPGSGAMPLRVGCDDTPCRLTAGTWILDGEFSFILGMEITVPDGWESREQDAGEFNLFPVTHPDDHIVMAKDIAAVKSDGSLAIAPGVPRTAEGITSYWRSDPNLVVSPSEPTTIGDGIPATTFVITISPDAKFIDPGCPVYPRCADFFTDPRYWDGGVYGIGAPAAVRVYLATIPNGARTHLLFIGLEGADEAALDRFVEEATPIIASIRIPASFPVW